MSELSGLKLPTTKSIGARPKGSQIALRSEDMGCVAIQQGPHETTVSAN